MSKKAVSLVNQTLATEGTGIIVDWVQDASDNVFFPIEMTPEDVEKGIPLSHTNCPLAECLMRTTEALAVVVSPYIVYSIHKDDTTGRNFAVRYLTTPSLREEITHFDRVSRERMYLSNQERKKLPLSFSPGTYVLRAPNRNQVLGSDHKRVDYDKPKKPRGQRSPRFSHRASGLLRLELRSVGREESR